MRIYFRTIVISFLFLLMLYPLFLLTSDILAEILYKLYPPQYHSVNIKDFSAKIAEIEGTITKDTYQETRFVFYIKNFRDLYFSKENLVDEAINYLYQKNHSNYERIIAIKSVQNVSVCEWARFNEKILDMYQNNQISYWEAEYATTPIEHSSNHFIFDFWRPCVRHVLHRLYFIKGFNENENKGFLLILLGASWALDVIFPCPECY